MLKPVTSDEHVWLKYLDSSTNPISEAKKKKHKASSRNWLDFIMSFWNPTAYSKVTDALFLA